MLSALRNIANKASYGQPGQSRPGFPMVLPGDSTSVMLPNKMPITSGLVPQYAGQRAGLTLEQVQNYNLNEADKTIGYTLSLAANQVNTFRIEVSGLAWLMTGVSFHAISQFANDAAMPESAVLMVNNEQVMREHPWTLIDVKYMTHIKYPIVRFLSGQDVIILSIKNGSTAQTVAFSLWYK